jgi:Kef-type K+ transport system membrane component KefB
MLVDLTYFTEITTFVIPAIIILLVFVAAKFFSCTVSTFASGFGAKNAIGAGLGMIAIGEFSLMIAAVAAGNENIRSEIYPMIVVVTTITALIVPYTVKASPRITRVLESRTPRSTLVLATYLNLVVRNLRRRSKTSHRISNEMRNNLSSLFVNIVIVISVVVGLGTVVQRADDLNDVVGGNSDLLILLAVTAAVALVIPAMYNVWTRTIRFVEVSTSEAMLSTKSGETIGYQATSKALRWTILGLYLCVGFVIVSPFVHSVLQENLLFAVFVIGMISIVVIALWNSVQTVNAKMCEVFERKDTPEYIGSSRELKEISKIISTMEREER